MAWVKIDDQFADHPKAAMAGPLGIAMQVAALCYANRYLTDGFIPCAVAPRLLDLTDLAEEMWDAKNPDDSHVEAYRIDHTWVIAKMVASGLWEDVQGGWQIHDYLDYNPSRADTLAKRAADLDRKKNPQRPPANSARIPTGIPTDSKRPVPVPVPQEEVREKERLTLSAKEGVQGEPPAPPPRPLRPDPSPPSGGGKVRAVPKPSTLNVDQKRRFDTWYSGYPNKQHRPEAEKAWAKLDPNAEMMGRLIGDVLARTKGRKWREGYIELPATYLNNRVWEDDIEPVRSIPARASPNGKTRLSVSEHNDLVFREVFGNEPADVPEVIEATFRRH